MSIASSNKRNNETNLWLTRAKKGQSRREKEIWKQILQFQEEKEKSEFPFPSFEKRKRNQKNILNTREEKEKGVLFAQASRGEREI